MSDCLFCKIVAGDIHSTMVAENDVAYAFDDIAPTAPVHVLVIPKHHITSADHLPSDHNGILDEMALLAQHVADVKGIRESGYRLVMNVGRDGQMTVPHLHLHVIGGRLMEWPPG